MNNKNNLSSFFSIKFWHILTITSISFSCINSFSDDTINSSLKNDNNLIDEYINSRGYSSIITFDASNIKQFWINRSVISSDEMIKVMTHSNHSVWESEKLKIQLANVDFNHICNVDVLTSNPDVSFSIYDSLDNKLSDSVPEQDFIQYHVLSSSYCLENAADSSLYLQFTSSNPNPIEIKKIVLSFVKNKRTILVLDSDKLSFRNTSTGESSIKIAGKRTEIFYQEMIETTNRNHFRVSAKIKNIGTVPATLRIGFITLSKDGSLISAKNYPYKGNNILHVISMNKGDKSFIVDTFPEWEKNCSVALNAKDDLSDIPSINFLGGRILDIKKINNGQAEIFMDSPLSQTLQENSSIRINNISAGALLYHRGKIVNPGEETFVNFFISHDDTLLEYTPKALAKGIFYLRPALYSYSNDPNEENTIMIENLLCSFE